MTAQPISRSAWVPYPGDAALVTLLSVEDDQQVVVGLHTPERVVHVRCLWYGDLPDVGDEVQFVVVKDRYLLAFPVGSRLFVQVANVGMFGDRGVALTGMFQVSGAA